ncbi:Ion-translocating oxidoreductase complex subunit C [Denitratisoma oestradiolicum]|uniref:Ion-translocating oxidoreductase complex subunit C n=2 Tax=Denitratisoma oestradiolicum TaxID=311182 RepID=A0A6S6XS96_9PROT|nr:electron transport complex subunit RsxC [Denitratisoma oestradiolicum]TWO81952.1 electron transport complex subunit RsxC [Denitratisoma oestradiolicum]CAB1368856.1 Ion-translocating oxidoreductase complex subunit C [Denitratisoma oestradiolicum]
MLRQLFKFNGGIKPPTHKTDSTRESIGIVPLPAELVIPLHQSVGGPPHPLVKAGEAVKKGQRIGAADGNVSSAIHASTSGRVTAVEMRTMAHSSGLSALCVVIEPDGRDEWIETSPVRWHSLPPDELRDTLRDAGVVGLGGAVFPSHLKVKAGREGLKHLVINGAECEPFITCDDMQMRERGSAVLKGALILGEILQAGEILVGIEDNKPEAVAAMQAAKLALGEKAARLSVVPIPTRYPAGGAKQLIRVLTGIEVPHGQRSTDYGVQCFNSGTACAIYEALELGRPMVSRIVTVAGNVDRPRNYEVLFGTPMRDVIALAGPRPDSDRVIMGGPMMGFLMPNDAVPVIKATNCILVGSKALFPPPPPEMPCIRCGECAKACPADLQPFEMYWHSRARLFGKAQEYHLFDCIECGCCAYVCPSNIPLVDYYRFAKSEIWARETEKEAADAARERYEFRLLRDEREKQEKAAKLAAKAAATKAKLAEEAAGRNAAAEGEAPAVIDDPKKALIAEALARVTAQQSLIASTTKVDEPPEAQA